jgi:regulator of replication initiation timing
MAWIVSFVSDISLSYALRGKDSKIKDYKKDTAELTKKIHQLELENTKLRAETNAPADDRAM